MSAARCRYYSKRLPRHLLKTVVQQSFLEALGKLVDAGTEGLMRNEVEKSRTYGERQHERLGPTRIETRTSSVKTLGVRIGELRASKSALGLSFKGRVEMLASEVDAFFCRLVFGIWPLTISDPH